MAREEDRGELWVLEEKSGRALKGRTLVRSYLADVGSCTVRVGTCHGGREEDDGCWQEESLTVVALPLSSSPPTPSSMAPRRPDRAPLSSRPSSESAPITGPTSALTSFLRVSLPLVSFDWTDEGWEASRNKVLQAM